MTPIAGEIEILGCGGSTPVRNSDTTVALVARPSNAYYLSVSFFTITVSEYLVSSRSVLGGSF